MVQQSVATELLELGAATVGESGGRTMRSRIHAAWPGARLAAPALPVDCTAGDNLAVHAAVADAPAGVALVVSVGEARELGYWGEVLTSAALARGVAGLVIDGCVRDVDRLEALAFPVFSTGVALPGATKRLPGVVGGKAHVGGVDVDVGDWIVGDRDGVCVVSRDAVDDVLAAARARARKEAAFFTALREGKTTVELLGLDTSKITKG